MYEDALINQIIDRLEKTSKLAVIAFDGRGQADFIADISNLVSYVKRKNCLRPAQKKSRFESTEI